MCIRDSKNAIRKPKTLYIDYRKEHITPCILIVIINANAEKIRVERDKKRGETKGMLDFISEKIEKFIFSLSFNVYLCFKSR